MTLGGDGSRRASIRLSDVEKRYFMYSSPMQLAADQLGLLRLPFLRRGPIPQFTALSGISLAVSSGERVGIVGRNGSGKTTLLKIITGVVDATVGTVHLDGSVQALMNAAGGFHPDLTGLQNIEAALALSGLQPAGRRQAIDDVIDFAELGPYLHQPFGVYSLGMQARTQFAVATAIRPDILVIDEVLGAGDGYFAAKSAARMKALVGSGCTLLLVSHDASQILQFCERVVWLRDGRIHMDGPAADVLAAYQSDMQEVSDAHAGGQVLVSHSINTFDLPSALDTSFVNDAIRAAEPISKGEVLVTRPGNRKVASYPGQEGLRIADITLSSSPPRSTGFAVGDGLSLNATLRCTKQGEYAIRCHLLIYSLSGERLASAVSDMIDLGRLEEGASKDASMSLSPLLLGARHYILSMMIEDASSSTNGKRPHFDLWSRFGYLSYAPTNDSDPPLLHLDAIWDFPDRSSEVTRVDQRI
jgi:lipopolysaccharide transport system ATP-binding protein